MRTASVELFTGAGGLALGLEQSGWHHLALVERDRHACDTIRMNKRRGLEPVTSWNLIDRDVKDVRYSELFKDVGMVAGGPPCQPFSLGGKHKGREDSRNMFPEAVRAVRELAPDVFVFENVKGLVRQSFATYFEYIILQLRHPLLCRKGNETWEEHLSRLERHHTSGRTDGASYRVVARRLNAADFGVPQSRHRVFIVGFKESLGCEWSFPTPTHNGERLLWAQWVSGEYWEEHRVSRSQRPSPSPKRLKRIERVRANYTLFPPPGSRWRTVRDALGGLPPPDEGTANQAFRNHEFRAGARAYPGHTGSQFDEPAKTLKAGDHGVPGGENMFVTPGGELRYFTVRESARLQTFPDAYGFSGSWTESMRQLGNAVPVRLAEIVGRSVMEQVSAAHGKEAGHPSARAVQPA